MEEKFIKKMDDVGDSLIHNLSVINAFDQADP